MLASGLQIHSKQHDDNVWRHFSDTNKDIVSRLAYLKQTGTA
jgi:hypothetical protein